ncbi:MAG: CBS domain-containing protein [Bacteriovoracaceae bacterium]|jgi:CBS domain-containing protein|nr:CBS domain-containing protein [Bacteriovoracaceae bacterium]
MNVKTTMTKIVVTLQEDDCIKDANHIMTALRCRHLPVIRGKEIVGIVSDRDLYLHSTLEDGVMIVPNMHIGKIMTTVVRTCDEKCSVSDAVSIMLNNKIDCLPVTNQSGHLLGIVTSTDLMHLLLDSEKEWLMGPLPFRYDIKSLHNYRATA